MAENVPFDQCWSDPLKARFGNMMGNLKMIIKYWKMSSNGWNIS